MNSQEPINFAFYVSGQATRLIKLLQKNSIVFDSTCLVINDNGPNEQLKMLLSKNGINYIEINYDALKLKGKDRNIHLSNLLLEEFRKSTIHYCFCFGYLILKGELLSVYKNKIINFHPSILPAFPGIDSIDQALASSSFLLGNTAHFINEKVDCGPVILQSIMHSSMYSTYDDVLNLQIQMLEQIYRWIMEGRLVIEGNKIRITDANYSRTIFYPEIDG